MFERFVGEARAVVREAERSARRAGDATVEPEHLLLALAEGKTTSAGRALASLGLDRDLLDAAIARDEEAVLESVGVTIGGRPPVPVAGRPGRPSFARTTRRALDEAVRAAAGRGDRRITAEHLLLGLLRTETSRVRRLLAGEGADLDAIAATLAEEREAP